MVERGFSALIADNGGGAWELATMIERQVLEQAVKHPADRLAGTHERSNGPAPWCVQKRNYYRDRAAR
jgi:hypothetical protein